MATADVHEEQLRDLLYRYWVKAGLALKYFKEGIEGFIDDCIKDQQRDILDEIRRQIGHPDASCDQCDVNKIRPHHYYKSTSCRFGKKCYCQDSKRIQCPYANDVCGRIFDKIVEQHRYGCPSFRNTDATKWCSDHWEIAKCFLDKSGYAGKMSASDTDCKGLLSIITNNMFVQSRLDTPIDKDKPDVFSKTKSARNEILHQATLQVTEEQLTAYIDTMIEALEDKKLKDDARSKTAIQKLKQLKDRALSVSTSDAFEVRSEALKAIDEKRQEVLEIIEEKKQDAIDVIEEKKEVDRLTTQYNQMKESLDNFMSSTSSNIQNLISRQDDLERQLADLESLEKMRELKALVLKKRADFKTDLMAFYRQNHGTLPLAPLVKEYDAPILDFYVKPSFKLADLTVENSNEKENHSVPFQSYQNIFFEDTRQCRNIYITSPAGLGKTSFVKHLVMTWCHAHQPRKEDEKHFKEYRDDVELMKSFEFIFLLALRDVPEEDCDVDAMIQNQIMFDLANSHCYDEKNFLKEILAKETCLIILDGLDEWSHPVTKTVACRCHKNKSIPRLIVRENCTVLTTTRPWKLTKAGISDASIEKHVEMTELSDSSFNKLVKDALSYMNVRYHKRKQLIDFEDEISKINLNKLERIPLVLMQLLCLWFDGKPVGSSRCAIFANMLELLFSRVESTDAEIMESDRTDVATNKKIPRCFIGNYHCLEKYVLLHSLGAMSFDALFPVKEHPHLVFDNDFMSKYLSESELQFCLKSGLLTQSRSRATVSARQPKTWFIHKTYQEFLAALYLSTSTDIAEKLSKQLFTVFSSLQDILDMLFFFTFLYGLCPADICVGISKRIESVVERTEDFQIYRTSLKSACNHSLLTVVVRYVFFMTECASEIKHNSSGLGIIPLKDFVYVEDGRFIDTEIEVIKSKWYCIKSLFWVPQAFLDSFDVSKIHSVQNLALDEDVNADSVCKLISNSLDTINAIEMPASCLGVTFDMLKKVVHLQAFHLYQATLTHHDLLQLYSWISHSTTLKQLELSHLVCRDHSSIRSSYRGLLLDLSAHEHLEFLKLISLEVDEVRICQAALKTCTLDGLKESKASVFIESLKIATNLDSIFLNGVSSSDVDAVLNLANIHNNVKRLQIIRKNNISCNHIDITFSTISNSLLRGFIDDIQCLVFDVNNVFWHCASEDGEISLPETFEYLSGKTGIHTVTPNRSGQVVQFVSCH